MKKQKSPSSHVAGNRKNTEVHGISNQQGDLNLAAPELQKLLLDMQVRQLEMEAQYKELQEALLNANNTTEKYSKLFQDAPTSYFTLNSKGEITESNRCGEKMLGKRCSEIINKQFRSFLVQDSRIIFDTFLTGIFSGKVKGYCEVSLLSGQKEGVHVQLSGKSAGNRESCLLTVFDISERTRHQQSLRDNEARFRGLFNDVALISVQGYAPDGTTQYWNKASEQLYGYTSAEAIGRNLLDLIIPPEMREMVSKAIKNMASTGKAIPASELMLMRKDGTRVPVFSSHTIIQLPGREQELFCIDVDLSDRRQAEVDLRESESKLRTIVEQTNDLIAISDKEGIIRFASAASGKLFQYTPEDLCGRSYTDLLAEEDIPAALEAFSKSLDEGIHPKNLEVQMKRRDGSFFTGELNGTRFQNDTIDGILVVIHDITDSKVAEEKLQNERLLLRTLIDNIPDSIYTKDMECRKTLANRAELGFMGAVTEEEVLGKNDFDFYPKELADKFLADDQQVLQTGKPIINREEYIVDKNGQRRWLLSTKLPLFDNENRIIGLVGIGRDITDRKNSLDLLRESEQKYRAVVENGFEGILIIDMEGNVLFANPSLLRTFQYEGLDDLVGKSVFRHFAPESIPQAIEDLTKVAQGIVLDVANYIGITSTGSKIWIESIGKIIEYNGNLVDIISVHDVTAKKQAEQALRESEEKYRLIAENTSDGIVSFGPDSRLIYASPSYLKQLGYSETEEMDRTLESLQEIVHSDDREPLFTKLLQAINSHLDRLTYTYRVKHKKGHYVWREDSARFNYDSAGNYLGANVICRDVTSRKLAEEQLRLQGAIVENMAEGVLLIKASDEIIVYANAAIANMFGGSIDEIVGKSISYFNAPTPDRSLIETATLVVRSLRLTGRWQGEVVNRKLDGTHIWCYANVTEFNHPEYGDIWVGIHQDITERKRVEQELLIAKDHAEESDRLKTAFLTNMSHEIRTPMNGIMGFAELLKEPSLTDEQQQNYIRIIRKSGDRMLNIINQLVDISKIESGQMPLSISDVQFSEVFGFLYSFFKPQAERKGIHLSCTNGLEMVISHIKTDREKLIAVLTNLLKNAIKFTEKGTIKFGCYANSDSKEIQPIFFVSDSGIGIPANRQKAIFDRFVQADVADKNALQGAGLGLSISKAYVEMLGGRIWVKSEEGSGAEFLFTISENPGNISVPVAGSEIIPIADMSEIKDLKVMIADDDETSEMLMSMIVRSFSREVLTVRSGNEAVAMCRQNPDIDLVMMDIQMPNMDGYECTRQIRQFNKDVVIIVQTAFGLTGDKEKAIAAGCNDYVPKPVNIEQLKLMIRKYFKNTNLNSKETE